MLPEQLLNSSLTFIEIQTTLDALHERLLILQQFLHLQKTLLVLPDPLNSLEYEIVVGLTQPDLFLLLQHFALFPLQKLDHCFPVEIVFNVLNLFHIYK